MTQTEVATWAGAIATLLAVLAALLKEEIVRLWRRPKITAVIRLEAPDCHKTELTWSNPASGQILARGWCYYFRLWVENNGRQPAERVQVFAAKLLRKHADAQFREEKSFLPMNLVWSHTKEIFKERISPGMGSHCDLGFIQEPSFRKQTRLAGARTLPTVPDVKTVLVLDLEVKPNTLSDVLAPGVYRIELLLAAANARPKRKVLEITVTGDWFDDDRKMFADGIGVKQLH